MRRVKPESHFDSGFGRHLGFAMTGVDANFVYFQFDDGLIARLPNAP
jgi:hypothetical protein